MKIFDFFKNETTEKTQEQKTTTISLSDINNFFSNTNNLALGSDLSEITYLTCLKILSETLGKLSIHLYDKDNNKVLKHDTIEILKTRSNEMMSPSTFKTVMEFNRNHYGNAYAYIQHDRKGNLTGLYPLNPLSMRIWIDNDNLTNKKMYYEYLTNSKSYILNAYDVLHVKGLTEDGISGMCIREVLARTLKGSKESQKYLNNLYEKGLTAKAVVKYTGDLNTEKKKALQKEFIELGSGEYGDVMPLPFGMDLIPLDLKLTDSQFFELKKYTALQIAGAFGIKPNQLNNYEKSSYANSEMQNLSFYVDTLLYILTIYEEELNYKLLTEAEREKGYTYKFNVATILRGDLKTQAEALNTYTTGGIYTVNEAREKLGMPRLSAGDVTMINGSYVKLEDIGKAYDKGGDTGEE